MKKKVLGLCTVVMLLSVLFVQAGGPPVRVRLAPPPMTEMPLPPPVIPVIPPPPEPPRMSAYGKLNVYMADYSAILGLSGFSKFSFSDAFGWSTKEVIPEYTLGVDVRDYLIGEFTWIPQVKRSGDGIPSVPLQIGSYTFGPRPVDTIKLSTSLGGKRLFAATPYFFDKQLMPAFMCEWWTLSNTVAGVPTTASTSQVAVEARQDFSKLFTGFGVAGQSQYSKLLALNYKALYITGGHSNGIFAEADLGFRQNNMALAAGYRYNTKTVGFGNGDFTLSTNGPFVSFSFTF